MTEPKEETKKFVSLKQVPVIHPAFTLPGLRWIIFNEKFNGASVFIRRIGKKIVVDLSAFENWVEGRNDHENAN